MSIQVYKEGLEISVSDDLKTLNEQIHALEWAIEFSDTTEKDKEIHKEALKLLRAQRERIKKANT